MVRPAKSSPTFVCFLAFAATLGFGLNTQAATLLWDGDTATAGQQDGSGNWNTTDTNRWYDSTVPGYQAWSNATPDSAIIGANSATSGIQTITLGAPIAAHDIEFKIQTLSSYVVTGTAANKLTLGGP